MLYFSINMYWSSYILRRPLNFAKSSPYFCPIYVVPVKYDMSCQSKVRWRFRKILWPSQNIWTLFGLVYLIRIRAILLPTGYGRPIMLFLKPQYFGLGQINLGALGVFWNNLLALILLLWVPCPCFLSINPYFYKNLSLYIQIFGIGVWILAVKN